MFNEFLSFRFNLSYFIAEMKGSLRLRIAAFGCLFFVLLSCEVGKKSENVTDLPPLEIPLSFLNFNIRISTAELEAGLNTVLPQLLADDSIPLGTGDDLLFIKIIREGNLELTLQNNRAFASIPLKVEASIRKKVFGITFSNESEPIVFRGLAKASANVDLDEGWNMKTQCQWQGFEWKGERPALQVMGMTLYVDKTIDKAIETNSTRIADVICEAIDKAVDFRKIITRVWENSQNPIRVAKNPKLLWLQHTPELLNAKLLTDQADALVIQMELKTRIAIGPEKIERVKKVLLNRRGPTLQSRTVLAAYPQLLIPFDLIDELLENNFIGHEIELEGNKMVITEISVGRSGQKLKVHLKVKGDFNGYIDAYGIPKLSSDYVFTLDQFSYELDLEEEWINLTNWALQGLVEEYVSSEIKIDAGDLIRSLPQRIEEGIGKTPMGQKLDLSIQFSRIEPHVMRLDDTGIQWIIYVEGKSSMELKRGVLKAKK